MTILVVEDKADQLKCLVNRIRGALPEAEILAFDKAGDALAALPLKKIDIAFLSVSAGSMNGVDLAKRIKDAFPVCDIVFCAGSGDYAVQAFDLGASDYLMKPVTKEKIEHALSQLRYNNVLRPKEHGLYIQCFGKFEVFYQGEPVASFTKRSKELLAYLVDKAGMVCAPTDISKDIFRGSSDSYLRVVKKDLIKSLSDIGQEDILVTGWGKLGIIRDKVRCDYYDYLDQKPGAANRYKGVYMSQYSWARMALLSRHEDKAE